MRRVLLCYERAPACHQQGDSPALAEDDGDDGADVLFTSVPVSMGASSACGIIGVEGTSRAQPSGLWRSRDGTRRRMPGLLCVANRLVCTLRSGKKARCSGETCGELL